MELTKKTKENLLSTERTKREIEFSDFYDSIAFDEQYDNEEYGTTTLYFEAPTQVLQLLSTEFPDAILAEISVEYPLNKQEANLASVMVSPTDEDGSDYDWNELLLFPEDIEELFRIANDAQDILLKNQEPRLIDGVTSCCGFDFGLDEDKANYCPVCGKKLIR